jgi:hypothetical protein
LNSNVPEWCSIEVPLIRRFKSLYSPHGHTYPPSFFRYKNRLFGFSNALKFFILLNIRALFPVFWSVKKNK